MQSNESKLSENVTPEMQEPTSALDEVTTINGVPINNKFVMKLMNAKMSDLSQGEFNDPEYLLLLASFKIKINDLQTAADLLMRSIKLGNAKALSLLTEIKYMEDKDKISDFNEYVEHLKKMDQNLLLPDTLFIISGYYMKQNYELSLEYANRVVQTLENYGPDKFPGARKHILTLLGMIHEKLGNLEKSYEYFEKSGDKILMIYSAFLLGDFDLTFRIYNEFLAERDIQTHDISFFVALLSKIKFGHDSEILGKYAQINNKVELFESLDWMNNSQESFFQLYEVTDMDNFLQKIRNL